MTQEEIKNLVITTVEFPTGFPADFDLNDNLLSNEKTLVIPNVFPGSFSIINNLGKLVSFPQKEYLENDVFGTIIDFSELFKISGNSLSGWKIRFNRGMRGEQGNAENLTPGSISDEDLIKIALIF